MGIHYYFHDLFKFSKTLGLAVTLKNFKTFLCFKVFLDFIESTDTNSGVHQNACRLPCLLAVLYLRLSLPCHLQ